MLTNYISVEDFKKSNNFIEFNPNDNIPYEKMMEIESKMKDDRIKDITIDDELFTGYAIGDKYDYTLTLDYIEIKCNVAYKYWVAFPVSKS